MNQNPPYQRIRKDSAHHRRILLVAVVLCLAAVLPAGLRLYGLMVREYDIYSVLARRNQSRTTSVTAARGTIYDRNGNILALSTGVENVYLNPNELRQAQEDLEAIAEFLGDLLV